jgi:hypothetical protein
MFTGFASENTPAIQVWDFFRTFATTTAIRSVSLADDCAPIQVFRTGATANSNIRVYLPTAPIEGKQITIVNQGYGSNSQSIAVYSSDRSGDGSNLPSFTMGQADSLILVYSKQNITYGASPGLVQTGWISLNKSSPAASNHYAAIVGGDNHSATAQYAFIGGGQSNTASGLSAFVGGGQSSTASANNSAAVGGSGNLTSGAQAVVAGGQNNTANSTNGAVIGGGLGSTRSIVGNFVTSASNTPIQSATGRQQLATLLLGVQTTDATATVLRSDTNAAGTTNQVILPNNSAYYFRGSVIANVTGGGNTKSWTFEGSIKRGANAAATSIVGAVILNTIAQDAGASAWVVAITADTTNGGLAVTVTGQAATTIRWVAKLESTEVTF